VANVESKDDVRFHVISAVTVRLLMAVVAVAAVTKSVDVVVITSGSDGTHSGPADPHHFGRALDLRTHNFPDLPAIQAFIAALQEDLGPKFYVALESPRTDNEHVHVQLRRFEDYP
jgi:hypothetical protein